MKSGNKRMRKVIVVVIIALLATSAGLAWWRHTDRQVLTLAWYSLLASAEQRSRYFEPALVADLPEPARRFFSSVIEPGTQISTVAEISMQGRFSLGTKEDHTDLPMQACQLLAPPHGFYWAMSAGSGLTRLSGSDGSTEQGSWTRFWLAGLLPVARLGGSSDHALSSFGRYMADSIFWVPGALLPSASVVWTPLGPDSARVTVTHNGLRQAYDLTVDDAGRPIRVRFDRWSDANEKKTYQWQSFGGYLSDFEQFDGYWLPTTIEAGNHFETEAYFPSFFAKVQSVRFINHVIEAPRCQLGRSD